MNHIYQDKCSISRSNFWSAVSCGDSIQVMWARWTNLPCKIIFKTNLMIQQISDKYDKGCPY